MTQVPDSLLREGIDDPNRYALLDILTNYCGTGLCVCMYACMYVYILMCACAGREKWREGRGVLFD